MNKIHLASITLAVLVVTMLGVSSMTVNHISNTNQKKEIVMEGMLIPYTVDDLTKRSKHIIVGTVQSITPTKPVIDEEHSITEIFSDVVIDVERDIANQYTGKQISVRILGGDSEEFNIVSDIDAQFSKREKVLVFVADKEPNSIWGDNYYIAGSKIGKFTLTNGKAYGPEYPLGIDEVTLTSKIKETRDRIQK